MRKKNILIVALLFAMSPQVYGQIKVTHVNPSANKPGTDGVFYIMPQTVLKIDVTVRVDEYQKGPLSEYAEKYFGIDDAIKYDYTTYEIEDVGISTLTEPDPEQVYYIEPVEQTSKELKTLLVQLNNSGYLVGANNIDLGIAPDDDNEQLVMYKDIDFKGGMADFIINSKIRTKVDTIIRKVDVDTVMVEKHFYRTRIINKTNEDLATEAMNKIEGIRDARYKLLTGFQETAYSAGTIAYMDGELKEQEMEYMALFRGKSFSGFDQFTFYYAPSAKSEKGGVNLFNFSSGTGITRAGSSSGEKVLLNIISGGVADVVDGFPIPVTAEGYQPGIFYRIPETCEIILEWDGDEISNGRFVINQFGIIRNLPNKDFKLEFHPETGGVKSIVIK